MSNASTTSATHRQLAGSRLRQGSSRPAMPSAKTGDQGSRPDSPENRKFSSWGSLHRR